MVKIFSICVAFSENVQTLPKPKGRRGERGQWGYKASITLPTYAGATCSTRALAVISGLDNFGLDTALSRFSRRMMHCIR